MQDLYVPSHLRGSITPHAIIALPRPTLVELLLCYDSEFECVNTVLLHVTSCTVFSDEGVYVNSTGGPVKDTRLQWGEIPSSIGKPAAVRFACDSVHADQ